MANLLDCLRIERFTEEELTEIEELRRRKVSDDNFDRHLEMLLRSEYNKRRTENNRVDS